MSHIKNSLNSYVQNLFEESIKAVLQKKAYVEKEKQAAATAKNEQDLFSKDEKSVEDSKKSETTSDAETEKLKKGDVTVDDVVEKLNSIRSGKSFKDENIANAMKEYIEKLSKAEKTALLAFLKGISQIVTGEISAEKAIEPDDAPAKVSMEKKNQQQTKQIKPNVIKTAKPEKPSSKGSPEEDTTPPAPIVPKKK